MYLIDKVARQARNTCLRHIRLAKSDFIKSELDNNKKDSRKFWQSIKTVIPDSKSSNKQFFLNDEQGLEVDFNATVGYINTFFASIGPKLAQNFHEEWAFHGKENDSVMPDFETNIVNIIKYVKEISEFKASAVTNIPSKLLFLETPYELKNKFDASLSLGNTQL